MSEADIIHILTINPGSTSTKFGVFVGTDPVFIKTIRHSNEELEPLRKSPISSTFAKA